LKNYLSKKTFPLKNNSFGNLKFFCIENFEKLDAEDLLKILESIKNQSYYNKNIYNKKKDSIKYSFLFHTSKKFLQNKLKESTKSFSDIGLKIFSKVDLIFCLDQNYLVNNDFYLEKQSNFLNENLFETLNKNKLNSQNNSIFILKKYIEFTNTFYPKSTKNASQLLNKIYIHLRLIQKNQKPNKLLFFTRINLNRLESIIRISESLSKMRSSNVIDCNTILDSVRIIQRVIITIDNLTKI
jgi:DNA replicative helicase MCM subunit Mcm2 (Cdc46/Mcm family)